MANWKLTCGRCGVARRCPRRGSSPVEDAGGAKLYCEQESEDRRSKTVLVPSTLVLDARTGEVRMVAVERLVVKKSLWRYLVGR